MSDHIHTVNALKIRNQLGEVLETEAPLPRYGRLYS